MKQKDASTESLKLPEIGEFHKQIPSEMSDIRNGLLRLDPHPAYEQLLKNKSVAIVGPARTMLGKKQGRMIDTYDIVVRLNEVFEHLPVTPSLGDDIGTRVDIIYCNQVILKKNILKQEGVSHEKFIKICDDAGIRYFVCTNNSLSFENTGKPSPSCDKQDKLVISDFKQFLSRHGMKTRFRLVYTASEILKGWLQGNWGRTGFIAVLDLLGFDISRLYVTGMTFYHGGGHLFSSDPIELHPLKNRDGTWARSHTGLGHNSYLELDIMRLLVRCFRPKLEVDEDLLMLLERDDK